MAIGSPAMSETASIVTIGARLDRLPISAFHRRLFILIGFGMFFDGFDIYLGGSVLGATLKEGFSTLSQNGLFISVTFIGMMIGAFLAGIVGDRFGRQMTFRLNLAIFGLAALAAAAAPNIHVLICMRFIMGLGLGAETVVGYSLITEFVPPVVRGRWSGYIAAIVTSGLPVSALLAYLFVPLFGWRVMFVFGGVGALIIWGLRRGLPESPRWLEAVGRKADAETLVAKLEADASKEGPLPSPRSSGKSPQIVDLHSLLRRPLISRMIVSCASLISINVLIYGFVTWLPSFMVRQGFDVASSFGYVLVMSLGGPIGSYLGALCADAIGRKRTIVGASIAVAIFAFVFMFASRPLALIVIGFLLIIPIYVLVSLLFGIYVPELFPTQLRLRATGFANTIGRAASIVTPLVVPPLVTARGIVGVLALMIGVSLAMAAIVSWLGIEPERRSLEDIAALD
jgi:MFS transporter, putative metabolite:H+ symporter